MKRDTRVLLRIVIVGAITGAAAALLSRYVENAMKEATAT